MVSDSLTIATADDVKTALRREFRGDEESYISSLLSKAENLIRVRYKALDELVLDEVVFDLVRNIEAEAVARVLRADDGGIYRSETEDGYSYQLNYMVASGLLDILEKDWKNLAQATGSGPSPRRLMAMLRHGTGAGGLISPCLRTGSFSTGGLLRIRSRISGTSQVVVCRE